MPASLTSIPPPVSETKQSGRGLTLLERSARETGRFLPSPEQLAEYERVAPGSSERIIRAHIEQYTVPTELQLRRIDDEGKKFRTVTTLFALVPVTLGLMALLLALAGKDGPSMAAFGAAAVSMLMVTLVVFRLFGTPQWPDDGAPE